MEANSRQRAHRGRRCLAGALSMVPSRRGWMRWVVIAAIILILASSSSAPGAIYYVAPSGGSDLNSGSINAPFNSIAHGISISDPGDTIYLRGGTYGLANGLNTRISIGSSLTGTAAQPVNLLAYPGDAMA